MNWNTFKGKFHKSWHSSMKKFIESKDCAKIYAFLKNQKGKEIAPQSNLTFRAFEQPLKEIKIVVLIEEPYCGKHNDIQYADGIPLSCDYVDKMHSHLNEFYDAMEREFYDLNLHVIKEKKLDFLTNQGVMFLSSSLTVELNSPGSHKDLWVPFIGNVIKNVFCKRNIPIIFCGSNIYEQYKFYIDPIYPSFVIKQPLSEWKLGIPWETDNKFMQANVHLWNKTENEDVMWVNQDVPF